MSKLETNWRKVKEGLVATGAEWVEAAGKIQQAAKAKDWSDALHHATDFRGAAQQHAWKLWFYTFWPKWIGMYFLAKWYFGG